MRFRYRKLAHILALGLIMTAAPGCPSNKNIQPPIVQATTPLGGATQVGRLPLIVFQFDRPMDPAFVNANYIAFNLSGTNTSIGSYTVQNIPSLNEVRIWPGSPLTLGQAYDIFCLGTIQSAKGTQMGSAQGITITVESTTNVSGSIAVAAGNPAAAPGGSAGQIDVTWPAASETLITPPGSAPVNHYDVYVSTTAGFEDFMIQTAPVYQTFASSAGGTLVGLTSGTTYYMIVIPRDDEGNVVEAVPFEFSATAP